METYFKVTGQYAGFSGKDYNKNRKKTCCPPGGQYESVVDSYCPLSGRSESGVDSHFPVSGQSESGVDSHFPVSGQSESGMDSHFPASGQSESGIDSRFPASGQLESVKMLTVRLADRRTFCHRNKIYKYIINILNK